LVSQDLGFSPSGKLYSLNGRLAYFNTDGYYSRIYSYENDILYSFSIPAFYGDGIRTYLNYQLKLNNQLTFWLKFAVTHQFAESGDEVQKAGSTKSELKIQLRYQF
jgi:hypothetical protein